MRGPQRLRSDSGVLQVAGRTFSAREVVQAADFRGELRSRWREFAFADACARAAEDLGLEPQEDALQAMSEEFRYERDLVTVEETEAWLEDRAVSFEEFDDYFIRRYWAQALPDTAHAAEADRPYAAAELDGTFGIDLVLSGDFFRMAVRLGRRAASLAAAGKSGGPAPEAIERERARFVGRHGVHVGGIEPSWLEELFRLEVAYGEHCRAVLGEPARLRLLQTLRLPLTRLEVETIEVDSLDAAREAALCVRDDGIELADLAKEHRYPYRRADVLFDQLDEELQKTFLAAVPGSVLQPTQDDGRYEVCRLVRKIEPELSDERVAARIDESLLDAHFGELTSKEVRWLLPVGTTG